MLLRRGARIAGRVAGRSLIAVHVVRSDGTRRHLRARRSRSSGCWPRTSAAACNSWSATTSPRPCWNSPGRSTAPRSSSAPPGTAGSRNWSGPAPPTRSSAGSGDIDVLRRHPPEGGAGIAPGSPLRGSSGRGPWPWLAAVLIPSVLAAALLPLRGELALSTVLLIFLLGVLANALIGGVAAGRAGRADRGLAGQPAVHPAVRLADHLRNPRTPSRWWFSSSSG